MRSVLELILPAGRADHALVLGAACPPRLRPEAEATHGSEPVELVVIAPTEAECRQEEWLARSAATCADRLGPDGVAYLLVPPRFRGRLRRRLGALGLRVESAMLHLPDPGDSRDVVPLEPRAARFAFSRVVPLRPWKRRAAAALLAAGAGRVLAARDARVALVARHAGARPLFAWLAAPGAEVAVPRGVVVSSSWRPHGAGVVLHPLPPRGEAGIVVKLSLDPDSEPRADGGKLARFGPAARRAGAAVPMPLAGPKLAGADVVTETRVPGELLAPALMRRPAGLDTALASVASWLAEWHRQTVADSAQVGERLDREVLRPLQQVAPRLQRGDEYVAALHARCRAAAAGPGPLAAAHNDLTMWNVLLDRNGRLGVVDWESAEEAALPLKDFFYAMVDAVAATRGYSDRLGAVRDCFEAGGAHADTISDLHDTILRAVGASPELAALSFHACWIGHAANELRSADAADPAPFRDIVEWLADQELASNGPLAAPLQ